MSPLPLTNIHGGYITVFKTLMNVFTEFFPMNDINNNSILFYVNKIYRHVGF